MAKSRSKSGALLAETVSLRVNMLRRSGDLTIRKRRIANGLFFHRGGGPVGRPSHLQRFQPVADARLGQQQARRLGRGFDLGAQLADEDAQILRVVGMGRPPDGGENLAMGDDPPGVAHQHFEQLVFLRRQLERLTVLGDAAAVESIQKRLTSYLGARVAVIHTPKKGRIVIEYRGNEDLQRLLEKMGAERSDPIP